MKMDRIEYRKIAGKKDQEKAFQVREKVFIEEQQVPRDEELDEFDAESHHFMAIDSNGDVVGTARWRFTREGVKLERFAVLKSYRGKGIGTGLMQAVLDDISYEPLARDQTLYLNAQLEAIPLYAKFSFKPNGPVFLECDIQHQKMTR